MSDDHSKPPTTEPLDEAGGRALVEAWRVSGLSGAAFCRQHNLRAQRMRPTTTPCSIKSPRQPAEQPSRRLG